MRLDWVVVIVEVPRPSSIGDALDAYYEIVFKVRRTRSRRGS